MQTNFENLSWPAFWAFLKQNGLALTDSQISTLQFGLSKYLYLLLEKNKLVNLTAIRDPEDALWKHFADSLMLARFDNYGAVLDWGSGGGIPGIPLLLYRMAVGNKASVSFLDSVGKKIHAIEEFCEQLELGSSFYYERGEAFIKRAESSSIDTVVMRAVAKPDELVSWIHPKIGRWVIMISEKQLDSWRAQEHKLNKRNFEMNFSASYTLPDPYGNRIILDILKK